jgi:hypothetical protein
MEVKTSKDSEVNSQVEVTCNEVRYTPREEYSIV